jgi:hypothetical protein
VGGQGDGCGRQREGPARGSSGANRTLTFCVHAIFGWSMRPRESVLAAPGSEARREGNGIRELDRGRGSGERNREERGSGERNWRRDRDRDREGTGLGTGKRQMPSEAGSAIGGWRARRRGAAPVGAAQAYEAVVRAIVHVRYAGARPAPAHVGPPLGPGRSLSSGPPQAGPVGRPEGVALTYGMGTGRALRPLRG